MMQNMKHENWNEPSIHNITERKRKEDGQRGQWSLQWQCDARGSTMIERLECLNRFDRRLLCHIQYIIWQNTQQSSAVHDGIILFVISLPHETHKIPTRKILSSLFTIFLHRILHVMDFRCDTSLRHPSHKQIRLDAVVRLQTFDASDLCPSDSSFFFSTIFGACRAIAADIRIKSKAVRC